MNQEPNGMGNRYPVASRQQISRPPKKKDGLAKRILIGFFRFCIVMMCVCVILGSVVAVMLSKYVVDVTEEDADMLDLDSIKLAQTTIIYAEDPDTGEWVEYADLSQENHRIWVDESQVPEYLKWAFVCTEDKDFYEEKYGVNFKRTILAAINEYTPLKIYSSRQGASTIEQQLIKNISGDNKQDAMRKVREIFRAIGISNRYSKQKILEAYMNTISLTGTIAGVQAGANEYFGKDVSELSLAECATIAGITKNPTKYNPYTNPEEVLTRRNDILYFMYTQGKISESEFQEASESPLVLKESQTATKLSTATSNNSYFTDALFYALLDELMEKKGMDEAEAKNTIYNGGLRIYATVNPKVQLAAEQIMLDEDEELFPPLWVEEETSQLNDEDIVVYEEDGVTPKTSKDDSGNTVYYRRVRSQASLCVMDYDGGIKAIVGGIGEKTQDLTLNRATIAHQTGSSMKPIAAYSLALDYKTINYSSPINDVPFYSKEDHKVVNTEYCLAHGYSTDPYNANTLANINCWRDWPSNYSGTYKNADVLVVDALAQSLNTVAVWVGSYVGVENMYNFCKDTLGLEHLVPEDEDYGPIVLGSQSNGLTAVELAGAYQIFNDGTYTEPHYYTRVETYDGELYLDTANELTSVQAISEETATIMNRLLSNVFTSSVGTARGMKPEGEMDAVAKTGTTSNFKDYTFVGLTPYYVTALWWGFDKPTNMYDLGAKNGKPIQLAWKQLMEEVQADLEYKEFFFSDNVITMPYSGGTGYYTADNLPESSDGTAEGTVTEDPTAALG